MIVFFSPNKHTVSVNSAHQRVLITSSFVSFLTHMTHHKQGHTERHQCLKSGSVCNNEGGQIHVNLLAIRLTPTIHCDLQTASSMLNPTFILSSSNRFFHLLHGLPLTFNLKVLCPSQDMTILFPQHITIPTNTVCHSQQIMCTMMYMNMCMNAESQ